MAEQPKYAQVKRILRKHIRTRYSAGDKLPSTTQLHEEIGVSPGTVNRAIRDLVEEGLIERFERRGTFVARGEKPTLKDIGFLWPDEVNEWMKDAYRGTVLHAAENEAQARDKQILVGRIGDPSKPKFTGQGSSRIAGVMLHFNHNPAVVKAYHDEGIPVVLVDPFVRMAGIPFVTSDHYAAAREATLYLTRLGHQHIVHVTLDFPISSMPAKERMMGYQEAMHEVGLDKLCHVHLMALAKAKGREPEKAAIASERLVAQHLLAMINKQRPTAICCFNDITAFRVVSACHENGIRVPEDISVVGINDDSLAEHMWPPLTTVHLPIDETGHAAVRLLDSLIQEDRLTGGGEILPVHLVERASAGPPPSSRRSS